MKSSLVGENFAQGKLAFVILNICYNYYAGPRQKNKKKRELIIKKRGRPLCRITTSFLLPGYRYNFTNFDIVLIVLPVRVWMV